MSNIPSGVDKVVIAAPETVSGTKPAANTGTYRRRVTLELNLNRDTYTSAEITSTAQTSDMRSGVDKIEGTLSGEMSCGSYAAEYANLLRGNWVAGASKTAITISAVALGNKLVDSANGWLTSGIKFGDQIQVAGFTTNTASFKATVVGVTANALTLSDDVKLVNESAGASISVTPVGKKLSIPLAPADRTDTTLTYEQFYGGANIDEIYTGCKIGSASVDIKPSAMSTNEFEIMGKGLELGAVQYFTTPAAAPTTATLSGAAGALYVDGVKSVVVTSLTLDINGNLEIAEVIGTRTIADIFSGRIAVEGEFSAYVLDNSLLQKFMNEQDGSLIFKQKGNSGEEFVITLPRIRISGAAKDDKETGGIIVTVPFTALLPLNNSGIDQSTIVLGDSTL